MSIAARRFLSLLFFALLLLQTACVTRVSDPVSLNTESEEFPESSLLDVSILPFEPLYSRLNQLPQGTEALRHSEGFYAAFTTASTLRETAGFGSVTLNAPLSPGSDVQMTGRVADADPDLFSVVITVHDATGRRWYTRQYRQSLEYGDYQTAEAEGKEPFQTLYNQIANDLLAYRRSLSAAELNRIRLTAAMLFAREFSPEAFSEYLSVGRDGKLTVLRLPPEDDPVFQQLAPIRQRHGLYLDALQVQLEGFHARIAAPYFHMRNNLMEAQRYLTNNIRQINPVARQQTFNQLIDGAKYQNSINFSLELLPLVIELNNQVYTLHGTVTEQYNAWKAILKDIYLEDRGGDASGLSDK